MVWITVKNYGNGWIVPKVVGAAGIVTSLFRIWNGIFNVYRLYSGISLLVVSCVVYTISAWMNYKICMCKYVGVQTTAELKRKGEELYDALWQQMNEGEHIQMNAYLDNKMKLEQTAYLYYYTQNKKWPEKPLF